MKRNRPQIVRSADRAAVLLIGLACLGLPIAALVAGATSYRNWWGALVFAPIGILFGAVAIVLALFPRIVER